MKFKGLYAAMTALSLIAAPTMAAAQPIATPLTQPAKEVVKGDNALSADSSSLAVLFLALAAIGAGIYIAVDKNDSSPASP